MSKYIYLLMLLCLGYTSLGAQQKQEPEELVVLQARIQRAAYKSQPRTLDSLLRVYKAKSKESRHFGRHLWGILYEIDQIKENDGNPIVKNYSEYHGLLQSSWLSDSDRTMLRWMMFKELVQTINQVKTGRGPEQSQEWTIQRYHAELKTLIRELWAQPEALRFNPSRKYPILSTHNTSMASAMALDLLSLEEWENGMADQQIQREIKMTLESYLKRAKEGDITLGARWVLATWSHTHYNAQLSALSALEKSYELKEEMYPFVHLIASKIAETDRRKAYQLLEKYTKEGKASKDFADTWQRNLNKLSEASLEMAIGHKVVMPASKRQTVAIETRLAKSVMVEIYRAPYTIEPSYDWQPDSNSKPIYQKRYLCPSDSLWEGSRLDIELPQQAPGRYYLQLVPELHESASNDSKHLKQGDNYDITNLYALLEGHINKEHQTALRLLDASTGRPKGNVPIRFFPIGYSRAEKKESAQDYTTDASGSIVLPSDTHYTFMRVLLEQDPIGTNCWTQQRYYEPEQSGYELALSSDRPVYRPGQTLHLYGYIIDQSIHAEKSHIVEGKMLKLSIRDRSYNLIKEDSLRSDHYGRIHYSYELDKSLPIGKVWIKLSTKSAEEREIREDIHIDLAEYKRPQSELILQTPRAQELVWGDTLEVKAELRNYSGDGLANIPVSLEMNAKRFFSYGRGVSKEEHNEAIELTTDSLGRISYRLPLRQLRNPEVLDSLERKLYNYDGYRMKLSATTATGEALGQSFVVYLNNPKSEQLSCTTAPLIERKKLGQSFSIASRVLQQAKISYRIEHEGQVVQRGECLSSEQVALGAWLSTAKLGRYTIKYSSNIAGHIKQGQTSFVVYDLGKPLPSLPDSSLFILERNASFKHSAPPKEFRLATTIPNSYVFYTIESDKGVLHRGMLRPKAGLMQAIPFRAPSDTLEHIRLSLYSVWQGKRYEAEQVYRREPEDKRLELRWASWRDRIRAGNEERWTLQVLHQGKPVRAALASWMYDASLDALASYQANHLSPSRHPGSFAYYQDELFNTQLKHLDPWRALIADRLDAPEGQTLTKHLLEAHRLGLTDLVPSVFDDVEGEEQGSMGQHLSDVVVTTGYAKKSAVTTGYAMKSASAPSPSIRGLAAEQRKANDTETTKAEPLRQSFAETAYVRPMMQTNELGEVSWEFKLPDALTRWRVEVFAHTKDFKTAHETKYLESYRKLQVEPNLPRFLRLGDQLGISSNVRNTSSEPLEGKLYIELFSPKTKELLHKSEKSFALSAGKSEAFTFDISAQSSLSTLDSVGLRLYAETASFSDGEEHLLPIVLPSSEVVRSQAITLIDGKKESFDLAKSLFPSTGYLPEAGELSIRIESNPLYLALLALPELGKVESENAISLASALYATGLGQELQRRQDLVQWVEERTQTLGQGLHGDRGKLMNASAQQTIWSEELRREQRQLAAFRSYLESSQKAELAKAWYSKLEALQTPDGSFAWYKGMSGSHYLTLEVMRLLYKRLAVVSTPEEEAKPILTKSWEYLHKEVDSTIKNIKKREQSNQDKKRGHSPHGLALSYLELLSYAPEQASKAKEYVDFFEPRLRKDVYQLGHADKARAALIYAEREPKLAEELLESLRQHLKESKEGMHFPQKSFAYWWYSRSYEALEQTISAMHKLSPKRDKARIVGMQRWILAQKRSTQWDNALSSISSVNALLLGRPTPSVAQTTAIELEMTGGKRLTTNSRERLGLDISFTKAQAPKTLTLSPSAGADVWASALARYQLPTSEDTATEGDLKTKRRLFVLRSTAGKEQRIELGDSTELRVGDQLLTSIEISINRELDFLVITDPRLGCAEPLVQTAGYRWEAGTGYYFEPRDKYTNFYIDHLRPGTYYLEYVQSVVRSGSYQVAATQAQSAYAPEYSASTGYGGIIQVKPLAN